MATKLQHRRYDNTTLQTVTGADGEIILDTDDYTRPTIHDGVTAGGHVIGGNNLQRSEWDQNGFEDRSDSTITWTDSTPDRTLTIAPAVTSYVYYIEGTKYTVTTSKTCQIADTEGLHVIYFDGATLTSVVNPTDAQVDAVIRTKAIVSIVYWNATDSKAEYVGEERHGCNMAHVTHSYLHFTEGLKYVYGLDLNTLSVDGDGSSNAHSQFGIDAGAVSDEDLYIATDAVTSTTGLPVYYFSGASAYLRSGTNSGYSALVTTTKPDWNEWTGATWQRTEMTDEYFAWVHVFASTEVDNPIFVHMGLAEYLTKVSAERGITGELENILENLTALPEMRPVAHVLIQADSTFTNDEKFIVVSTYHGDNYFDSKISNIKRGVVDLGIYELELTGVGAYVTSSAGTTCTAQNTWYELAGTFANLPLENFSVTAGPPAAIVYDGTATATFLINYSGSLTGDSNAINYEIGIAKNGSDPIVAGEVIANSVNADNLVTSGVTQPISGQTIVELETNDTITIVIRSTNGTGDVITADYFTATIKPFFGG